MINDTKYARAFKILCDLEYSNKPELFLHKNRNEEFLTIGGIAERYNSELDWEFIRSIVLDCKGDFKRASEMLYSDRITRMSVFNLFKQNYWNKLRLDEVQAQNTCEEMFISAVHIGVVNASKLAQRVVHAEDDGVIGDISIKMLNNYDENLFDTEFDVRELGYYEKVLERKPNLKYARRGFVNRAYKV